MKLCWNITSNCNRNCRFCFRERNGIERTLDQNLVILNNLEKIDVTKITFAGGEPLLYNGIEKLLEASKQKGIYNKLVTNGSLLNKTNIHLYLKNVDRIAFSVDSNSDEENYILGRGMPHYKHIQEIIPLIHEEFPKIKIDINTTIIRQTIKNTENFYKSLLNDFPSNSISRWKVLRFCPLRGLAKENYKEFSITDEDFLGLKKNFLNINAPFIISFVDNDDIVEKNVVNAEGILEVTQNNKKVFKDMLSAGLINKSKYASFSLQSNINLNLYKTFFDVAQYGSLSLASKKMLISQPAISKSIKRLEEDLNVNLFYRTIYGMTLTEKGRELYSYVEDAYNSLKTAERSMMESNDLNKGKLLVGVPSHIASFYLFDKIKKFHNDYPEIEISIISRSTKELIKRLENHELDFVIDASPIEKGEKELVIEELTKVNHCFAALKTRNYNNIINCLRDLESYQLILPVAKSSHRKKLNDLLFNHNVVIKNAISIETSEMIRESILQDMGIGYVLDKVIEKEVNNNIIEIINLEEELPSITLNLVYIEKYLMNVPKLFITNYLKKDGNS